MKYLVLGATGTLGTEFVKQILDRGCESVRVYARNENKMFWLKSQINDDRVRYCIGDIRDKDRLDMAFKDIDIVINCAAMKHVSLCEENPQEAIKTNVDGVQNAIQCAIYNKIKVFVQISTDKAVNATCIYGRTKALAEDLVLNAWHYQGKTDTKFIVFRSGNIKGSSGSVLEIWRKQFDAAQPLTVTDINAKRYMQTKEKIVKAILDNIQVNNGLCVLNMPMYTIGELLKSEYPTADYIEVGLKKGEKLIEELYSVNEDFKLIETEVDHYG